jgi:hypothetical protein
MSDACCAARKVATRCLPQGAIALLRHLEAVIASEAKQSRATGVTDRDCFVAFGSSQ